MDSVMVSICCLAYNHEKYIRQCLDGFLMQKGVTFEVLIHDDASTDQTADIIREYEAKYPGIIKPIYQTENQYSKGVRVSSTYQYPRAQGKYIAFCEGDDYWTDPNKLAKQYAVMEANPNLHLCVHKIQIINEDGTVYGQCIPNEWCIPSTDYPNGLISSEVMIKALCRDMPFQLSSFFCITEDLKEYSRNTPVFALDAPVGDVPLYAYLACLGPSFFISDSMSCYRRMSDSSWSKLITHDKQMQIEHKEQMIRVCLEFDEYTHGQLSLNNRAKACSVHILRLNGDAKSAFFKMLECRHCFSKKSQLVFFLEAFAPGLLDLYRKIKGKIHK